MYTTHLQKMPVCKNFITITIEIIKTENNFILSFNDIHFYNASLDGKNTYSGDLQNTIFCKIKASKLEYRKASFVLFYLNN